jgi:hypothetical protein
MTLEKVKQKIEKIDDKPLEITILNIENILKRT